MQDELNSKVVALVVQTGTKSMKMTEEVLKAAMRKFLKQYEQSKSQMATRKSQPRHGEQTVAQLMEQNEGLTNIEINDQNIGSFRKIANRYNIDFALTTVLGSDPPKYIVFFKAKDIDVMTQAFREYTQEQMNRANRPSLRQSLNRALEVVKEQSKEIAKNLVRLLHRGRER